MMSRSPSPGWTSTTAPSSSARPRGRPSGKSSYRSRPYKKNDQATIESKNNHLVRRYGFYYRYDTTEERVVLNRLWRLVNDRLNSLTPTKKPTGFGTDRNGRRTRLYDKPATPLDRLLAANILAPKQQAELVTYRHTLNCSTPTASSTAGLSPRNCAPSRPGDCAGRGRSGLSESVPSPRQSFRATSSSVPCVSRGRTASWGGRETWPRERPFDSPTKACALFRAVTPILDDLRARVGFAPHNEGIAPERLYFPLMTGT